MQADGSSQEPQKIVTQLVPYTPIHAMYMQLFEADPAPIFSFRWKT